MRTNLPVTGLEIPLPEGEFIVSKTDTRGIITYVNKTFLEILEKMSHEGATRVSACSATFKA